MDDLREQRDEKSLVIRAKGTMADHRLDLGGRFRVSEPEDTRAGLKTLGKRSARRRLQAAHREREDFRNQNKVAGGQKHRLTTDDRHPAMAIDHGAIKGASKFRVLDEPLRSEEHTSELQSLMRISYAVF